MKKLSKILILVLAVALICTGLVLAVSADDTSFDLVAAIDSAVADENGMTTVTLEGDATLDSAYIIAKDLTINLNGYTLSSTAADMFVIESAITVKIVGDGNINLAGRLVNCSTAGAAYSFTLEGATGINVNHTGTAAPHIVLAAGGTHTFEKVNVLSTRTGGNEFDAFFRGTLDAESKTGNGTAENLKFYFNTFSFYSDVIPAKQNDQTFVMPTGTGSYVEFNDSTVLNGGTLLYFGYTTEDSVEDVLCNVYDSNLQIISTDNRQRSCLIWGHKSDGAGTFDLYGSVNFYDSYIGGNAYRAIHFGQALSGKFQINFDHTVVAHNGANDATDNNADDSIVVRGASLLFKNNSTLIGMDNNLGMSSAVIKAEVGTRFNNALVGGSSHITWIDSDGAAVSGVQIVLDPVGNLQHPYIGVTDSSAAYLPTGASAMNFYAMESMRGIRSQSPYGIIVDGVGSFAKVGWAEGWQSGFALEAGAATTVSYGNNTSFKYWINPTTASPNYGDSRIIPNNEKDSNGNTIKHDSFMIFGTAHNLDYSKQIAKLASTKVAVFEMDIATDSDYGFPRAALKSQARSEYTGTSGGGDASGDQQFYLNNDGTFSNGNLVNFNGNIKLSHEKWNHITCVMYTDSVYNEDGSAGIGQNFVYVNGELLGYSNYAFKDNAGYVMGLRFNITQGVDQIVGASMLVDNVSLRAYGDYLGENEADGAVKSPDLYLLNDVFYKNNTPVNNDITAAGRAYSNVNDAVVAANQLGVSVELNDDVYDEQKIINNAIVSTNGYNLAVDNDSYGFVVDGDKYTFNEDYWYNAYWYNGALGNTEAMLDDANYIKTIAKVGHELDYENLFTDGTVNLDILQIVTQDGWAYDYNATQKITSFVPTLAELEAAKADASRAARFYPVITGVDMDYYLKNASGEVYKGGIDSADIVDVINNFNSGDTLVLLDDAILGENFVITSTAEAPKLINIDLNGYTLSRTTTGIFFEIGAYTTVNVYSSVAGGMLVATTTTNGTSVASGSTAFAISDGTTGCRTPSQNDIYSLIAYNRAEVTDAYVNVGKFGDIPGSNMTVVADRLFFGHKGGENCTMTSDGANIYSPSSDKTVVVETYTYDGNVNVKNAIMFAPLKQNVVNANGFSESSKISGARFSGFEEEIITADIRFETLIIVNKVSGMGDSTNDNVVSNNGDGAYVTITFNNVVATGRLNPSNEMRNSMDGFVAAEKHDCKTANPTAGTVNAECNIPMTWQALDLGITESVLAFTIPAYNTTTGEMVNCITYNVANNGTSVEGLANAYVLPRLTGATVNAEDAVKVIWNGLGTNAAAKTEYYVAGTAYKTITAPTAVAGYQLNVTKQVFDGNWTGIPEAGTIITESVNVTPGYRVVANLPGLKVNLSLYSDFLMNFYIPVSYKDYIVSVNDKELDGEIVTLGEGENATEYYKLTFKILTNNINKAARLEIKVKEGEHTVTKSVIMTVFDYVTSILEDFNNDYSDADEILAYYVLNYICAAYTYFNGSEYSGMLEIIDRHASSFSSIVVDHSYANALENTGLGGVFTEAGIKLGEAPAFTLVPGGTFAGTVTVTYGNGNVRTFKVPEGSTAKIVIEGMKIYNFGGDINVTATAEDGTIVAEGKINLDTYAKYHTNNAENYNSETQEASEAALPLIQSLYDYVKIAEQFKAGTLQFPAAE